jgi:hypothetical protein
VKPGVEPIGIAERGELLPGANEGLLHRVFGEIGHPKDEERHGVEAVATRRREGIECPVVPMARGLDEIAPHAHSILGKRPVLGACFLL